MRGKSLLLLMLALGCGLVASIGITQVMAKRSTDASAPTETQAIFVAKADVATGDLITAEAIKLEEWPVDKIPEGAITRLEDIEGKRPKSRIYSGSPILQAQLGGFSGATESIPDGYRAIPVKVDSVSGGSNMLHPGDRVDVSLHLERNPNRGILQTETRVILQDIKVFAVNDTWEMDPEGGGQKIKAQTISLLVTPVQAQKVILAEELGRIRLVMRSPGDSDEAEIASVTVADLLGPTETGDRDEDSPALEQPVQTSPSEDSAFLRFLANQQKSAATAETVMTSVPNETQVWKMRSINGDQVEDVILEFEGDSATETAQAGFSLWKLMSSAARAGASERGLSEDEPAEEEVPAEAEEEPFTEDDDSDQDPEDMARWPNDE